IKTKIFKFLKIIISSLLITVLLLFTIAAIRTLSLDVNAGLQLAHWEKTNNKSLVIDHHQREELLANFKEAIRIPTVSFSNTESNTTALHEFDRFLRKAFPTVFSSSLVHHELVANYSHLGFYIGLGHDEEISGLNGAMNIVRILKQRGVQLLFVMDEGLTISDGIIPGLEGPAALIGLSEKGQAAIKLSVSVAPGHSSMPPRETSIGILATAVKRLEDNPMPRLFGYGPEGDTFEHLAHKFSLPLKFIMSNLWLFSPLLSRILERKPVSNAFVRTTTAVTFFNAGVKINVIPSLAEAYVNLRIHSAQSVQEVESFLRMNALLCTL
uniref:N-acyl-aliphatic-L-amino acid amidohydrolase n=1 Tax=Haplochromis burtoni TaxID=8153 RepID=A0A3Q2VA73_HAPBU